MANDRITQEPVEVLITPDSDARVTQEPVEVLVSGDPEARMTQLPVEVLQRNLRESVIVIIFD